MIPEQNLKPALVSLLFFTLLAGRITAQPDCSAASSGFIPINDLGEKTFINAWSEVWQGGLYPDGSNYLPLTHKNAGLLLASQVQCLDSEGKPDAENGKIVWLSIGMSNTTQETQQFIPLANSFPGKNPKLILVDGAQGGMTALIISTSSSTNYNTFWTAVGKRLSNAGVNEKQVQVIWLKEADVAGNSSIKIYYDSLTVRIKRIANELKGRFPNAKLCYLSGRISARYASSSLNPEPYAYYSGWVIKKVIGDQINGDPELKFSGPGAKAPWLAWGPYFWSDGNTPQISDPNTFWVCPDDFQNDGTHPSVPTGARKAGNLLLKFFTSDSTCIPWLLGSGCPESMSVKEPDKNPEFNIFPNPFASQTIMLTGTTLRSAVLTIYNSKGQYVKQVKNISGNSIPLQRGDLPCGLYFLRMTEQNQSIFSTKIIIAD